MKRTCREKHPIPEETAATCRLCWLYVNDQKYRDLWGPEDAPHGITSSIMSCQRRGLWEWVVREDGRVIASGVETSKADAEREVALAKEEVTFGR